MSHSEALLAPLLSILAGLFALAALLILVAGWRGGPRLANRLWIAYLTEFAILAAILVPAYAGVGALLVSLLAIGTLSARELYAALVRIGLRPRTLLGLGAGAGLLVAAGLGDRAGLTVAFFSLAALVLVACLLRPGPRVGAAGAAGATLFGLLYPAAFLGHLLLLARLDNGFGYVVFLFGLIEIHDSAAYLVGSLVGGRKLWPSVSPNKTLAGAGAGLAATLVGANLLAFTVPAFAPVEVLLAGGLIALLGLAGDLVASALKREAGLKDFADLVPAQGGLLDIYDALIFTAPAFYYYAHYAATT